METFTLHNFEKLKSCQGKCRGNRTHRGFYSNELVIHKNPWILCRPWVVRNVIEQVLEKVCIQTSSNTYCAACRTYYFSSSGYIPEEEPSVNRKTPSVNRKTFQKFKNNYCPLQGGRTGLHVRGCGCPRMIFMTHPESWSSPPLLHLRDINSKLLTHYDCKEDCSLSQSQTHHELVNR
jgi:hypothetical protein